MTTPTGPITLGDVAAELQIGLPLTIGDGRCRELASVPSGPITLGQLRGKSRAAANGVLLSQFCSGTTLMGRYADGNGGTYDSAIQGNSPTCGYVPPPASGTQLSTFCSGTTLYGRYANGSGGSYDAAIEGNSPTCGYVPPTPRGTLLLQYCSGTDLYGNFADGNGGVYVQMIEGRSGQCGYVPPPVRGTLITTYCNSGNVGGEGGGQFYNLMGIYADGSGGQYEDIIAYNAPECGAPGNGGFQGG